VNPDVQVAALDPQLVRTDLRKMLEQTLRASCVQKATPSHLRRRNGTFTNGDHRESHDKADLRQLQ
jgi:hypothetical protein